jgi:hypothetical protein
MISFSSSAYYLKVKDSNKLKLLNGLLPSLKNCFWPNMDYYAMLASKKGNQSIQKKGDTSNGGFGQYYGKIRGSIVHTQLHDYLFYNNYFFEKKHKQLHPWSKRILEEIIKKGWIPIISEFNVFDSKTNIGTSIDMVCYCRSKSKIILIEIKTGYKNVFESKRGTMSGCLKKIMPLSFEYCATLQLVVPMLFIMKNHCIDLSNLEGHVIQINDNEFNFYKISESFILENGKNIYDSLVKSYTSSIIKKRKQKKDKRTLNQIKKTPKKISKKKK